MKPDKLIARRDKYIKSAKEIHNDFYDYSFVNYTGCDNNVIIVCPLHGEFSVSLRSHSKGVSCMGCATERRKQTNLKKYGVENVSQNVDVKERRKQTNLKKYGVENVFLNKEINETIKQQNITKYGVEYPFQCKSIHEKAKQTLKEKYGVEHNSQLDSFKENCKQTLLERYGVDHIKQIHYTKEIIEKLNSFEWLYDQHIIQEKSLVTISTEIGVSDLTIKKYCMGFGIETKLFKKSGGEIQIGDFLSKYTNIKTLDRSILSPKELDIYIPEKKVAIEYNGLYWHSSLFKPNNYHKEKYELCKSNSIRLITIYEDEWLNKQELIKKKLLHILGINNDKKIYARKCNIRLISNYDKKLFFDQNHIQGDGPSSINIGLYYKVELVACMGFKIQKDSTYELTRYATKYNVVGGFTRLLSYFKKTYNWSNIITFADLRWHDGNVYHKSGFVIDGILKPDYQYVIGDNRYHKFNFRLDKIKQKFPDKYRENETEIQNMDRIGIPRIYDCGKIRFILSNHRD